MLLLDVLARLNAEAFCSGDFALCSSAEIADMHFRPGYKYFFLKKYHQ